MSEWHEYELSEIAFLSNKKSLVSDLDINNYISTENMLPNLGGISLSSGFPTVDKVKTFIKKDVLFSNIRTYFKKVWFAKYDGGCSNDVLVFRAKSLLNSQYLYYILTDNNFINYSVKTSKGTKMPRGDKDAINNYKVFLPPLPEQKAIAHILGTLDDKIELNRRQNETLEAMAQALFKSWFVDFDPVLDNALAAGNTIPPALQKKAAQRQAVGDKKKLSAKNPALAQLFPASFEFNEELGKWVPEGWENGKLGDRYFVKGGFAFKSKDFVEKNGTPVVKIKSIKGDNSIDKSDLSMVSTSVAKQREDFWLNTGDILMAMTGATVGKFGVVVKDEEELIVLNQRVAKFYSKTLELRKIWFVYCFFNDSRNTDFIVNTAQGSAQPNISANEIMSAPMILSDLNLVQKFEEMVLPSFQKIIESQKQTETLTQLRDTLLPQLISGKLRLSSKAMIGVNETID
jgi:type I restriction enzyme S subunit